MLSMLAHLAANEPGRAGMMDWVKSCLLKLAGKRRRIQAEEFSLRRYCGSMEAGSG